MAPQTYHSVVLAKRPKDQITAGETFSVVSNPRPAEDDLKDGQVLVEVLYLSLDPAMRGWLNGGCPYAFAFTPIFQARFRDLSTYSRLIDNFNPQMLAPISLLSR